MSKENAYVFVVCGAKEHLDTLRLSFSILRKKTQLPIYIVTDSKRNEGVIDFGEIIDVPTDPNFDHHQASIFLKTSLHTILPVGKTYAYLDTDIIAYGNNPDAIFAQFVPPIVFANDHCRMRQFSSYAVNCGCLPMLTEKRNLFNQLQNVADPLSTSKDPQIVERRKNLFLQFDQSKRNGKLGMGFYLRYFFSWPYFNISPEFRFNKKKKTWEHTDGQVVMHKLNLKKIAKQAGIHWNRITNKLSLPDGKDLWIDNCNHLAEMIRKKFDITITEPNWQHWNGGVFLFNHQSYEFLDAWHQYTLEIFKDPEWKTRDQGTLIATAWKHNLEKHATLRQQWNMILDYHYPQLKIADDGSITLDGKNYLHPQFVHIYHHWGDANWEVWNKVMTRVNSI